MKKNVKFIAYDIEKGMVKEAKKRCKGLKNVSIKLMDILDIDFGKADLIVSYYTMQFIKPKNRQIVFNRIYEALNWGGGFILLEKVRAVDVRFQDMMTSLYTEYKLEKGYTTDEIIAKSQSLKGVLEPFSTHGNMDLLKRAGFVDIMTIQNIYVLKVS